MIVLTNRKAGEVYFRIVAPIVGARFICRMKWSSVSDNLLWLVAAAEVALVVTFLTLVLVMMPS